MPAAVCLCVPLAYCSWVNTCDLSSWQVNGKLRANEAEKLSHFVMALTGIVRAAEIPAVPPNVKYTCGVFLSGKYVFTQYLTLKSGGNYESSTGASGKFHFDAGSKRLLFDSGKLEPLFGSYEPTKTYPMFRLSSREDAAASDYTRAWASQVCSGH